MGNLIKRTTYKTGPNSRTTITQNLTTGKMTTSSSQKVGSVRVTQSRNNRSSKTKLTKTYSHGGGWFSKEYATSGIKKSNNKMKKQPKKRARKLSELDSQKIGSIINGWMLVFGVVVLLLFLLGI